MDKYSLLGSPDSDALFSDLESMLWGDFHASLPLITKFCSKSGLALRKVDLTNEN